MKTIPPDSTLSILQYLELRSIFLDTYFLFKVSTVLMNCSAESFDVPFVDLDLYYPPLIPRLCWCYMCYSSDSLDSRTFSSLSVGEAFFFLLSLGTIHVYLEYLFLLPLNE